MKRAKKSNLKKNYVLAFIFLLALAIIISIGTIAVRATGEVIYNANEWETFKSRTKEEVGEQYGYAMGYDTTYRDDDRTTWYKTTPSTEYPYNVGELTQDTHEVMTRYVNFYRWLEGAEPLIAPSESTEELQAGALVRNFYFDHTVPDSYKPEDMDEDLFKLGQDADHNILARYSTPRGAIRAWVNEGYSMNSQSFNTTGHRTALTSSSNAELRFGYAGSIAIGDIYRGGNTQNKAFYAFPTPGYMPTEEINPYGSAWTIELNDDIITNANYDNVTVVVTNLNTNESYECTTANGKLLSYSRLLTFVQPTTDESYYADGEKFKVEVYGLIDKATGNDAKLEYTTEFFDVTNYAPSIATEAYAGEGYDNIVMKSADDDKLDQVSKILSDEILVRTDSGREVTIPVKGEWKVDKDRECFVNAGDTSALPEGITDPDHVLDEIIVTYEIDSSDGSRLMSIANEKEGTQGHILLWRYMSGCDNYELHQVYKDEDGEYVGQKRFDQDDNIPMYGETGWLDFSMTYTLNDSGTYYGLYYKTSSYFNDAYVTDGLQIEVEEREVESINISNMPNKLSYKVGETLDVTGGKIEITYEDGSKTTLDITSEMITGFNTTSKGVKTITVAYKNKTATYEILVVDNIDGLNAVYGNKLSDVTLPSDEYGKYTWQVDSSTSVGEIGKNAFKVKYTPNDSKYAEISDLIATITVDKATPNYNKNIVLNAVYGNKLSDIKLPDDENGTYEFEQELTTSVGNAGTNKNITISYTPKDTAHYNIVNKIPVTINVEKANPTYTLPTGLRARAGDTLSKTTLPKGFTWNNPDESVGNEVGTKTFEAIYTPEDSANYKIVKVNIELLIRDMPKFDVPTNLTATYGDTLASITLPTAENGKFTFEEELTTSVGNAGTNTFYLTFTPNDLEVYDIVEHIAVNITVNKKKADPITIPTLGEITYNPNKTLAEIKLPDGWAWEKPETIPTVDNQGYKAIYTPTDALNYDYSDQNLTPNLTLKVSKATPEYTAPILVAYRNQTLKDVELPTMSNGKFVWQDDVNTPVGEIGTRTFKVTFIPNDAVNYETIKDIVATLEVGKNKPEYTVPTNLTATYGDTLANITLPKGFTWDNPNESVGSVGEHTFLATYTPEDTENFAIVNNIEIKIKVNKKKADPITIPTLEEITYSPNTTLADIKLPEGWKWEDESIVPTVDNKGYKAIYTPTDTVNYDYSDQNLEPTLKLTVNKANATYTVPEDIIAYWGSKIEELSLPEGFTWEEEGTLDEIGTRKVKVTYTPKDNVNYNTAEGIEVTVRVIPAPLPNVEFPEENIKVEKQENLTLADVELPTGWYWDEPETVVTEGAGPYLAIYEISEEDKEHYNTPIAYINIELVEKDELAEENSDGDIIDNNSNNNEENNLNSPKTFDNIYFYVILLVISGVAISLIIIKKKYKSKH